MKLEWSVRAERDLIAIGDHVAADRPAAALALILRLRSRARSTLRFPHIGRVVPEFGRPDIREVVEGSYRIVYRLKEAKITVLTVFDAHRLLPLKQPGRMPRRPLRGGR